MTFIVVAFAVLVLVGGVVGLAGGLLARRLRPAIARVAFCVLLVASVVPHLFHYEIVASAGWRPGEVTRAVQAESLRIFAWRTYATLAVALTLALAAALLTTAFTAEVPVLPVLIAAALPSVVFVVYFEWALRRSFPPADRPLIENVANVWLFIYSAAESVGLAVFGWVSLAPRDDNSGRSC